MQSCPTIIRGRSEVHPRGWQMAGAPGRLGATCKWMQSLAGVLRINRARPGFYQAVAQFGPWAADAAYDCPLQVGFVDADL